jgi:hypothetical protein
MTVSTAGLSTTINPITTCATRGGFFSLKATLVREPTLNARA